MKTVYVAVAVRVEDNVDVQEFINNTDYDFDYPGVVDTEIIGFETAEPRSMQCQSTT